MKKYIWVILVVFIWWFIQGVYLGINMPASEGDSIYIHIPAATRILEGSIFNLDSKKDLFYPSSTELLLAIFIFLKIPLGLFNIFGSMLLLSGSFLLANKIFNDKYYSLMFGMTITLMHGIYRWNLTQKPDVIMLASLAFILWIILKKKKTLKNYLFLGFFCGLFAGAKFNGPLFLLLILLPFYKRIYLDLSWKKILIFLILFIPIGASWYIRNIIITGNPVYFPEYSRMVTEGLMIRSYLYDQIRLFNAYISEFMMWSFGFIAIPLYLFINRKKIKYKKNELLTKFYIGVLSTFIISLAFPYWSNYDQLVFTMRYLLPIIFLIILCLFIIFKNHKLENLLAINVIIMSIVSLTPNYHPKIMIPFVILVFVLYLVKVKFFPKLTIKFIGINN